MYWTSLLLSIAAGLVAVAIAQIFIRRAKWGRGAYYTAFAIGALGFWLLLDDTITPSIELGRGEDALTVERALEGFDYYDLLVTHDPEEGRRMRERIERVVADPGYSDDMRRATSAEIHMRLVGRYAPHASDSAAVGFIRSQLRIVRALLDRDSNACFAYLRKEERPGLNPKLLLPPDLLAADSIAMRNLIVSGIRTPASPRDTLRGRFLLALAYDSLFGRNPDYIDLLTEPELPSQRKYAYCSLMLDLYRIVLAMPHDEAAIVARVLIGRDEIEG